MSGLNKVSETTVLCVEFRKQGEVPVRVTVGQNLFTAIIEGVNQYRTEIGEPRLDRTKAKVLVGDKWLSTDGRLSPKTLHLILNTPPLVVP